MEGRRGYKTLNLPFMCRSEPNFMVSSPIITVDIYVNVNFVTCQEAKWMCHLLNTHFNLLVALQESQSVTKVTRIDPLLHREYLYQM